MRRTLWPTRKECDETLVPAVDQDEAKVPTMRRAPREPTRQDFDITTSSYFSVLVPTLQCRHGYVKRWPHRSIRDVEGVAGAAPSVHVDVWFMRDDEVDEIVTVINYTEKHTKAFGARVVEKQ